MTLAEQFPAGSRVIVTTARKNPEGTVMGYTYAHITHTAYVNVLRDGLRTVRSYHPALLQRVV